MAYREDADLAFLEQCTNADLAPLVSYLIKAPDGETRFTETLTVSDDYKRFGQDYMRYWSRIAEELQLFGANTLGTILRGGDGIPYREILTDVCDKMKVNYSKNASVPFIESALLMKILVDSLDSMDEAARRELVASLELKTTNFTGPAVAAALQGAVVAGGFVAYQVAVVVANAVAQQLLGRGLAIAANATLTRAIGVLAGPIGIAVTALWTLVSLAGPAYRVTIPSVIQVAFLRASRADRTRAVT